MILPAIYRYLLYIQQPIINIGKIINWLYKQTYLRYFSYLIIIFVLGNMNVCPIFRCYMT